MSEKQTISHDDWLETVASIRIPRHDLNSLVLNYLIIEGYREAAEKFAQESGCQSIMDPEDLDQRRHIRQAVMEGAIDEAISAVNEFDADVLDRNPELLFRLRLQKLIEYIKSGAVQEALAFSQEVLAPATVGRPHLLHALEEVMALLAFEKPEDSPVGHLVQTSQLHSVAAELNSAILATTGQNSDANLMILMKMLTWSQRRLQECVSFTS